MIRHSSINHYHSNNDKKRDKIYSYNPIFMKDLKKDVIHSLNRTVSKEAMETIKEQ